MSWTRPCDLKAQLLKMWDRGELLRGFVTEESVFPKRLLLKVPTSAEMAERFDEVRVWINTIRSLPRYRIEMREFNHRLLGTNAVPGEVWIDSDVDAVAIIGRQRDTARFIELVAMTRKQRPQLLPWLSKRPLRAVELYDEWALLLAIISWLEQHPRPGMYLRQVDIPGVQSKFIEAHRVVLSELLDLVLPPEAIDYSVSGTARFAARYGFRDKPVRIRFRMLDPRHALLPGGGEQDITLDAESFARLEPGVARVFITENEINFLAFPPIQESLVLFGAGYGFEMLKNAGWLSHCHIHYWGDIDTHGFAILNQLRGLFNTVESFLMDRGTLLEFKSYWGVEGKQVLHDLPRLTLEEKALYNELRDNRICRNLRLEQEMISFGRVESALAKLH
ncbi:MAG TPA: hypothetical protein HPP97_09835 [Desulfuromonadales bacterium]|nr:hypothetical protein [Desulfuromonadales bacterium]